LQNIEAVLGALGWDLIPIPRDRAIDADILDELQPIADRIGLRLGDAVQFATEIAMGLHRPARGDAIGPVSRPA
jgi:hypothetical protein